MEFELKKTGNWSYYCLPELEKLNLSHGFFTKYSPSPLPQGEGREEFLRAFYFKDVVILHQKHSDEVHVVKDGNKPASGDAIILVEKGIAGIIKTADCLPVIICDPEIPMASIIHAGWRGTVKKITQKTIDEMAKLGAEKKRMRALLGPSINPCCYEVGDEVYESFRNEGFSEEIFEKVHGSRFLSIRQANRELIRNAGIDMIYDLNICTCCNKDLFNSFRRGDREKRQINFVSLKE